MLKPSVLIIRPQVIAGKSCCGTINKEQLQEDSSFLRQRQTASQMVNLFNEIKTTYGCSIEIELVDCQHRFYIATRLVRDALRFKASLGQLLTAIFKSGTSAVFVNGRLFTNRPITDYKSILEKIKQVS